MDPEPKVQLYVDRKAESERQVSNTLYSDKIVQKIVFGVIITAGTIAVSVLTYQVVTFVTSHMGVTASTTKP